MVLEETLALPQPRHPPVREAKRALRRAGARAEAVAVGLHHLSVVGANGEILVQRQYDRRPRQDTVDQRQDLRPEADQVMQLHDVGSKLGQPLGERAVEIGERTRGEPAMVVTVEVQEHLVRPLAQAHQRGGGMAQ